MVHPALLRNKFFVVLITLCCACHSHRVVQGVSLFIPETDKALQKKNGLLFYGENLFTGKIFGWYPAATDTAFIQSYTDGVENGTWLKFYPGHQLREIREFDHGKKTGTLTAYWPGGKKQLEYFFVNDEYEGTCREWSSGGMLIREMNYRAGHENGAQHLYYDNGKVRSNYQVINGRRYGLLGTKNCVNVSDSIFKK